MRTGSILLSISIIDAIGWVLGRHGILSKPRSHSGAVSSMKQNPNPSEYPCGHTSTVADQEMAMDILQRLL